MPIFLLCNCFKGQDNLCMNTKINVMKKEDLTKPSEQTPGEQTGHYETGTPENVKQETDRLNSLGQFDSDSPKPVPPQQ